MKSKWKEEQLERIIGKKAKPKLKIWAHNVNIHPIEKQNQYIDGALYVIETERKNYRGENDEDEEQAREEEEEEQQKKEEEKINIMIWVPYTTLFTLNEQMVMHETATGNYVTANTLLNKYRMKTEKKDTQTTTGGEQQQQQELYISAKIEDKTKEEENDDLKQLNKHQHTEYSIIIPTSSLVSIKQFHQKLGWSSMVLTDEHKQTYRPLFFHDGGMYAFLSDLKKYVHMEQDKRDKTQWLIKDINEPLEKALKEQNFDDLFKKIYAKDKSNFFSSIGRSITREVKKLPVMGTKLPNFNHNEKPVQLQQLVNIDPKEMDMDYMMNDRIDEQQYDDDTCQQIEIKMKTMPFKVNQLQAMSLSEFHSYFDDEGRVLQEEAIKDAVFSRGIQDEARSEVWPFLLGLFDWNSTAIERTSLLETLEAEYACYCAQWENISERQRKYFSDYVERESIIDKDVIRTDRSQSFFKDDDGEGLLKLRRILLSYSMYNFELGYCQGMSDLCSTILDVCRDEALSFWCFHELMEVKQANFRVDQKGMNRQLSSLLNIIKTLDYQFFVFLSNMDATNMFYAYRWLLVSFKREFSFAEIKRLWESFFSNVCSSNMHLFFAYAILSSHKQTIMSKRMSYDELMRFCIDLSQQLSLEQVGEVAVKAYASYTSKASS